ncbi:flavodoxin domain-containing protein [Neobacillus terrae]|uniref:flavodoxin domain-containing protein n=1 Tax=Neobacillus terrae TaxID=3034837 RepID=UPI00140800D4|nr:flavodoxin domain-containing protein [Neobacillus terrae]NHM30777.1 flavodoxin [Neobacillus terrae]
MSYKIALIYTSVTGNTKRLIEILEKCFQKYSHSLQIFIAQEFPIEEMAAYDAIIIATYTWGNGCIPKEIRQIYRGFERPDIRNLVTGVAGTGDSFYPNFCGAVDAFRDMLVVQTNLAATLKIELAPQSKDYTRCVKFSDSIIKRLRLK